jgi:hypothetical protein
VLVQFCQDNTISVILFYPIGHFIFVKKKSMITDIQRRNQILKRISKIPKEKLKALDDYISKLEHEPAREKRTLSFAGAWKELDESVFDEFTKKLINNRQKNRRRIDE